jgi:hypothetical protein
MRTFVFLTIIAVATATAPLAAGAQNLPPYARPDPAASTAAAPPAPAAAPESSPPPEDPAITARAKSWLRRAQTNDYDRSQLEPQMSAAITPDGAKQAAASLTALGKPTAFTYVDMLTSGKNLKTYVYRVTFPSATLNWLFTVDDAGKIAGFYLHPEDAPPEQNKPAS